jgi:hypothetical protein
MRRLKRESGSDKESAGAVAIGALIMATTIPHLDLSAEDREFVNQELKWLFSAVDRFQQFLQTVRQRLAAEESAIRQRFIQELGAEFYILADKKSQAELARVTPQIWRAEVEQTPPVSEPIPPEAERLSLANNKILAELDPAELPNWSRTAEAILTRVNLHLKGLNILLDQEARLGEAGRTDFSTQSQIKYRRVELFKALQELALLMQQVYGVLVSSPNQLIDFLEEG